MKRKKITLAIVVLVVIGAIAMPTINLIAGLPEGGLAKIECTDPGFTEAAAVMEGKCAHCHIAGTDMPFYASLPVASTLIGKDVELGLHYIDLADDLAATENGPLEVALAKIEYVKDEGSMPPMRYVSLHWNAGLSGNDKKAIDEWISQTRAARFAAEGCAEECQGEVIRPVPSTHSENMAKVALGEKLYNDVRLSGDDTLSCASCHGLDKGGTDQAAVSTGIDGQLGPINSPTVYNAVFMTKQFWDGRAVDLKDQAAGPVANPIEMGADWDDVVAKLNKDEALKAEFVKEYPEGLSEDTITDAIAIFEKTLITPNSPLDKYLLGDKDALDSAEKNGFKAFQSLGCASCHCGEAIGGQSFELMGRAADYFADRGDIKEVDRGRFNHTKDEADKFKFKTPTLRNIALTFPYFHDASATTLEEAVTSMAKYQVGEELSKMQTQELVAFLNALTGEYNGQLLK